MSNPPDKGYSDYEYREHELHLDRAADAVGYWFALAVVLAFLVAGVIVYRAGNPELRTATDIGTTIAQTTAPVAPQQH